MYAPEAQLAKHRSAVGLARAARGTFTFHDDSTFNRLSGIDAPTLVVAGEQEVRFMDSARHLAQMIPNARLEIVAGAGHSPNLEQPDEFNRLVQFFLDQVGISTAHGKPPART